MCDQHGAAIQPRHAPGCWSKSGKKQGLGSSVHNSSQHYSPQYLCPWESWLVLRIWIFSSKWQVLKQSVTELSMEMHEPTPLWNADVDWKLLLLFWDPQECIKYHLTFLMALFYFSLISQNAQELGAYCYLTVFVT